MKNLQNFDAKWFAKLINDLEIQTTSDNVYYFLCRLAWTVSKQYDEEEQLMALEEECEMFQKDSNCFDND